MKFSEDSPELHKMLCWEFSRILSHQINHFDVPRFWQVEPVVPCGWDTSSGLVSSLGPPACTAAKWSAGPVCDWAARWSPGCRPSPAEAETSWGLGAASFLVTASQRTLESEDD